jgi:DNA-binding NarL/FixJ family response regulator
LDLRLPDGPGIRLLERVRRDGLACKVAVVTGADRTDVLADAVMLAPETFLRKPVDFGDLLAWLEGAPPAPQGFFDGQPVPPRWRT